MISIPVITFSFIIREENANNDYEMLRVRLPYKEPIIYVDKLIHDIKGGIEKMNENLVR